MKKLIILSLLTLISLKFYAQEVNISEYRDYKQCVECSTEKWNNSNEGGVSDTKKKIQSSANNAPSQTKTFFSKTSKDVVLFCSTLVATIASVIIYKKVSNEISNIH